MKQTFRTPSLNFEYKRSRHEGNIKFGSRTDKGYVRQANEDSLVASPPLFAVADGMGGHAAGEVASEIAISTLEDRINHNTNVHELGQAVEYANRAVILAADERQGLKGMGTTLTAALVQEDRVSIAHVGDSRAYLLYQGKLQQITRDHSLMADLIESGTLSAEEASTHPKRSVITRALGSDARMTPDLYEINIQAGDRLLLCSDGLSSMVESAEIESILARIRDPQRCADSLVNAALDAGGHDNITVIVVDVSHISEKAHKRSLRKSRALVIGIILSMLCLIGLAFAGTYSLINTSAYLKGEEGYVAVYQGLPDTFLGIPLSHQDHISQVALKDLQPGLATRLQEGVIRVDNLEAANKLVEEYQMNIAQKDAARAKLSREEEQRRIAEGDL